MTTSTDIDNLAFTLEVLPKIKRELSAEYESKISDLNQQIEQLRQSLEVSESEKAKLQLESEQLPAQIEAAVVDATTQHEKALEKAEQRRKKITDLYNDSQSQLKAFKAMDPKSLEKRNKSLKKKTEEQAASITGLKEQIAKQKTKIKSLDELVDAAKPLDPVWESEDGKWTAFFSEFQYRNEEKKSIKVRVLNQDNGESRVALMDDDRRITFCESEPVPQDVLEDITKALLKNSIAKKVLLKDFS
ncbi:hypothetical protein [Neptuniibacter sp. QD37_11]|uniref:hypothetical protein n=1 Tax=Neptuniibacter sp. QD37_11 TaxID=3398209 RepID=UPI0039F561AD